MNNLHNSTGFYWWTGVVEDRMDPLFMGRCRVRIFGYHTKDKSELPTPDLPWAIPMQPITSAGVTGIGHSPTGPVEGTWVVGFFSDGDDCQQPVFMGTIAGLPQSSYENNIPANVGFSDPNKKYPLRELLDEPDTNRLARNQKISETIVQKKRDSRDLKVDVAFGGSWDQPKVPYSAKYPFNHVTYTESGHAIELDDTPSSERIHIYHKKGTFTEIDQTGSMVRRVVADDYQIIEADGFIHIKGKANVTVDGSCNVYVKNNCNLQVDGNLKMHAHGNIEMKSGKTISIAAKTGVTIHSDTSVTVKSNTTTSIDAGAALNMKGAIVSIVSASRIALTSITTAISSLITSVNILSMIGMTMRIPPIPVIPGLPSPVSPEDTINPKSPQEPQIPNPSFTLSEEEKLEFQAEKIKADSEIASHGTVAKEYSELKADEINKGEKVSVQTNEEIVKEATCEAVKKVIEAAKKDIGILETGTKVNNGAGKNYGGLVGGGETPVGQPGRIDEMLKLTGLNNQDKVKQTGEGYYWCAAAVTAWWKEAGLPTPPGSESCKNWAKWAKQKGYYSKTPKLGAAVLFGAEGEEYHIGIVAEISEDSKNPEKKIIKTIEGNTGGGEFNRNGCGCFTKIANPSRISGYVHVPEECPPLPAQPSLTDDCMSPEMTQYIDSLKNKIPEPVRAELPAVVCKFKIDTPLRMSHFLSQCSHESSGFKNTRESLNYSATGLRTTFKKYFPTDELAKQYERQPEKIANRVYAGERLGNGDEASGDGYKYRGRGYIQLTGRRNYTAFNKFVPEDVVENPELVATKYPLLSAAWFWSTRNINSRADKGDTTAVVSEVTKVVNGGYNGLKDRQDKFNTFISLA